MQIDAILSTTVVAATTIGGFIGGKRTASRDQAAVANDTVTLLQAQVESVMATRDEKDRLVSSLENRVQVLESLVTQRAEVEAVHEEVIGVRHVVAAIAAKVGAL